MLQRDKQQIDSEILPDAFQTSTGDSFLNAVGIWKKLTFTLFLIISGAGFVYQSFLYTKNYLLYETVVDIRMSDSPETELPSVTICINEGVLRSKACKYQDTQCLSIGEIAMHGKHICECLPDRYCENGTARNVMMPPESFYSDLYVRKLEEYEMFLSNSDDVNLTCSFYDEYDKAKECDFSMVKRFHFISTVFKTSISSCWTLNTFIGKSNMKNFVSSKGRLVLSLTIDESEYPVFYHPPEAKISIHNPNQVINPHVDGFILPINTHNIFNLRKVVKKRVPHPYNTNCVDYLSKWNERGGYGPTNENECIRECQANTSFEIKGCVLLLYKLHYPLSKGVCADLKGWKDSEEQQKFEEKTELCKEKNCGKACLEENYLATKDSVETNRKGFCGKHTNNMMDEKMKHLISVTINLNNMQTMTYNYIPKYESIEISSNLAGYIGIWLGVSFIYVINLLEEIFSSLMNSFKKLLKRRTNS